MPSLLTILVLLTATILLWYAIKGEKPIDLINRSFGKG